MEVRMQSEMPWLHRANPLMKQHQKQNLTVYSICSQLQNLLLLPIAGHY